MLLLSAKKSQYLWICCVWQDAYGVYHVWQVHTHIYIDTQCLTRIRINTYMPYIRTRRAQGWSGLTGSSARGNTETAPQFSHVGQFWLGILDSSWFPILPTSTIAHFERMWKCIFKCINLHADENVLCRRRRRGTDPRRWHLATRLFTQHWLCLTSYHPLVLLLFKDRCYSLTFLLVRILDSDWWAVRRFRASHWWRAWLLLLMVVVESSRHRSRN